MSRIELSRVLRLRWSSRQIGESAPREKAHCEKVLAFMRANFVDWNHVWMFQKSSGFGLSVETMNGFARSQGARGKEL